MFRFKVNCLELLKEKGMNQTILYKTKILNQNTVQKLRKGIVPGIHELERICRLLEMQPGEIIEYVEEQ